MGYAADLLDMSSRPRGRSGIEASGGGEELKLPTAGTATAATATAGSAAAATAAAGSAAATTATATATAGAAAATTSGASGTTRGTDADACEPLGSLALGATTTLGGLLEVLLALDVLREPFLLTELLESAQHLADGLALPGFDSDGHERSGGSGGDSGSEGTI
jgi:hypothetical protein